MFPAGNFRMQVERSIQDKPGGAKFVSELRIDGA
jgi:hypothetical protein